MSNAAVFVNGRRITDAELRDGDWLTVGYTTLVFSTSPVDVKNPRERSERAHAYQSVSSRESRCGAGALSCPAGAALWRRGVHAQAPPSGRNRHGASSRAGGRKGIVVKVMKNSKAVASISEDGA